MSISAAFNALRGAGRQQLSASIIAARQATGSHIFRIDGFTQLRKTVGNGDELRSGKFSVGGHNWRLSCYPNGDRQETEGCISLFLNHASHTRTGDATAKGQLSVLDQAGWNPWRTIDLEERRYSASRGLSWGYKHFVKHEDLDAEKHLILKDDCLTILCDLTVNELRTDDHVIEAAAAPEEPTVVVKPTVVVEPPFAMPGKLAEFIWNNKEVDVQIEVGGETLPAHRRILEAGSPVFKADLSLASATTGSGDSSSRTALLRVDDMDAEVFKALLQFIYTDSPPPLEAATMAERLLVAADRYELERLKLVCEEALCRHIDMSSVAVTLAFAERHHCSVLRAACVQFLSSPGNMEAFMGSDGFEQLRTACPSALLELVLKKITI